MGLLSSLFGGGKKKKKAVTNDRDDDRAEAIAAMQAQAGNLVTPERAELVRNAMAVHKAKQTILADLSSEDRARLVASAITTLLHSETDPPKR